MPEPTLTLTYTSLRQEVGFFLGYGRDSTAWDATQTATVNFVVTSGLRQFYNPPPLPGEKASYDWSFMRPVGQLSLPTGASSVPLWDDFGGTEGDVTVQATGSPQTVSPWVLRPCNEGYVRELYATSPLQTGRPMHAAVRWEKGTTADRSQRATLVVWPQADRDYTLQVAYYVNPDALSASFPYHMGGMPHSETVLASCKAAAERDLDDQIDGPQQRNYLVRLAASVNADRRNKPQALGYNGDRSDWKHAGRGRDLTRHDWNYGGVTVNGVQY